MTETSIRGPFLPAGPYRLAGGYARRAFLLGWMLRGFGLLFVALLAWVMSQRVPALLQDAAIWNAADAVEAPAEFEGRVSSRLGVWPEYRGTVRFVAADGSRHEQRLEFETLLEIDRDTPSVVRYLPSDPDAFVYCWAGENITQRWLSLLVLGVVFGALLVPALWFLGGRWVRQCRLAAAIAEDGCEATARVLEVREQKQYGRVVSRVVRVELQTPDGPCKFGEVFGKKQGLPCLVDARRVLCVVSPRFPKLAVLLRDDLYPLELPAGQQEQALQRIAAAVANRDTTRNDAGAVS
ncbi:MAG: hypothetical protein KDC48_13355 [Planctomycetes bacterium]|nr:hypothetical protein [Planctomycetota bacterium]